MNTTNKNSKAISALLIFFAAVQCSFATTLSNPVLEVVDTNPDPNIFEAELSADEQDVMIDGTLVHALIYKDVNRPGGYPGVSPDGIPIPQIVIDVGDEVIVTLTNDFENPCSAIACDTSIHWHGLELDADSDGTGVSQNRLEPGQSYTYRFIAPRPGVFWFHPHMKPGPQTFAGTYGSFIVRDPNEAALIADGRIPAPANTHTIVLSDIEYNPGGDVGYFWNHDGDNMTPDEFGRWAEIKEICVHGPGMGPPMTPMELGIQQAACKGITDAETVLVNGRTASASVPMIKAKSESGVRLRLINPSTNRYFRLGVEDNGLDDMTDNNLYRIGGEGGFLENARLEGGVLGSWDTEYSTGEVLVSSSQRADVVVVPVGNDGDIIKIVGGEYHRGGPLGLPAFTGIAEAAGDILYIEIDDTEVDPDVPYAIADGSVVLGSGGVEDVKSETISDFYIDPATSPGNPINPGLGSGSDSPVILLNGGGQGVAQIDGTTGEFEDSGLDFSMVPYQGATRYAKTGDLLEFTIANATAQHHPFHHHGFSFQPVRVIDLGDTSDPMDDVVLYEYDYDEWLDVIDIFDKQAITVRMRLEDRPRITDDRQELTAPAPNQFFSSGGAAGRWVFHCHLFLHAAIGMISELVVVDTDRDGDGFDTSEDCDDFDPNINPDAEEICDDGIDNNCNAMVDEDLTPPELVVSTNPTVLWPPDHKYSAIPASQNVISVSDNCADLTLADVKLTMVSSDEPDNSDADGNTDDDIVIADDCLSVDLRSERQGSGNGRVYTAFLEVIDDHGNAANASTFITVPHMENSVAADDGPAHTVGGVCTP